MTGAAVTGAAVTGAATGATLNNTYSNPGSLPCYPVVCVLQRYLEENMKLTDEYKRTTEQFKDLQGKFRLFEQVDTKKYADVWAMKEAEVAAVVKQLLQADKVRVGFGTI